ncbi:hypothetical protein HK405_002025 [Cladochytrium tenue]|nr:hypothetical protein HK405_002025 [Cladochytrium tenue]
MSSTCLPLPLPAPAPHHCVSSFCPHASLSERQQLARLDDCLDLVESMHGAGIQPDWVPGAVITLIHWLDPRWANLERAKLAHRDARAAAAAAPGLRSTALFMPELYTALFRAADPATGFSTRDGPTWNALC